MIVPLKAKGNGSMRRLVIAKRAALAVCCSCTVGTVHGAESRDPLVFFASEQLSYDDNLFRLGDSPEQRAERPPVEHPQDYINRLSAGVRATLQQGRQDLLVTARINDVRFSNNDQLDHTGGAGAVVFNWELGSRWSGRASADYSRALASYTNYRFFERDVVSALSGEFEGRFRLGPHFRLVAAGRATRTDHSDSKRESGNFLGNSGRAGIEYSPLQGKLFLLEYRYSKGEFPDRIAVAGSTARERDYEDDVLNLRMEYELTSKLRFQGNVGFLERKYPFATDDTGFDGEIWRGTIDWQPRLKLGFELSAWREIKAYIDDESNYFVAKGVSFGPTWKPLTKVELALSYSYEKQNYIGTPKTSTDLTSPEAALIADAGRSDDVRVARASASYAPRDYIELTLSWAYQERESNRALHGHDAQVAGMEARVAF